MKSTMLSTGRVLFAAFSVIMSAVILFSAPSAEAQRRGRGAVSATESRVSYDLSGAVGSYNGESYTEITLGLNWMMSDWFNWRNSVFSRSGASIESVQGLDSSARFQFQTRSDDGSFGIDAFAGPGVRLASKDHNAVFGEAGLTFKLGGLRIGGGVKALTYVANRTDPNGASLPKSDTQVFLVLAGGGTL